MPGRTYSAQTGYRYGFNGKENDNEIKGEGNQQDYGMRIYDPRLGRFLSVDPLESEFPWLSPYIYAEGNPVNFTDLDGAETNVEPAQAVRLPTLPRVTLPETRNIGNYDVMRNSTRLFPEGVQINSGSYASQIKRITQEEFERMVPPNCGVTIDPGGKTATVHGPNGSWGISLLKIEEPRTPDTWFSRAVARISMEHIQQSIVAKTQITTDHSKLTDEQLQETLDRITLGQGTNQDWQYWPEIQNRLGNGRLPLKKDEKVLENQAEQITFIQGSREKATKITVALPEGYKKTKLLSHGQAVYSNGKKWITPDADGHNGGIWKLYESEKAVGSGDREGTYSGDLKERIGD